MLVFFQTSMVTYISYFIIVNKMNILTSLTYIKKFKTKIIGRKKDIGESVQRNRCSGIQIMTAKTTSTRTLYVHVVF